MNAGRCELDYVQRPDGMTYVQFGVTLIGAAYLAIGILGFVPLDAVNPPSPHTDGTHYLLRHFAVNPLHNLIHVVLGLAGLWLARTTRGVPTWGLVIGPILLALALVGVIQAVVEGLPIDQLLLGILPLNSPGHMFHLVTGGFALYLGLAGLQRHHGRASPSGSGVTTPVMDSAG
jgi:hypothetical protein